MVNRYKSNQLDGAEIAVNDKVKERCFELARFITDNIKKSKDKEIALMKLEECAMWATKAVAYHGTPVGKSNTIK